MTLRRSTATTAICLLAAMAGVIPAAAAEVVPPPDAAPLLAVELLSIYGNHTWLWGTTGGAYFKIDGRQFLGYSVKNDVTTTAKGKWHISDTGKLCFEADWVNPSGSYPGSSCFEHVAGSDGQIFVRSLPDGTWSVFKHVPPDPTDQFSKLVRDDLVSANLQTGQ